MNGGCFLGMGAFRYPMALLGFQARAVAVFRFFSPVLAVIFLASVLAFFATLSQTQVEAAVFTPDEDSGAVGNAGAGLGNTLLFILPAVLGSFGIVYIIRKGKRRLLKYIFRGALTLTTGIILAFFNGALKMLHVELHGRQGILYLMGNLLGHLPPGRFTLRLRQECRAPT